MFSDDLAISISGLSKTFQIYDTPRDRLKQFLIPTLRKLVKQKCKNYFREFTAVKNVTFQIKRGETVGIIGRNGSGKSTLLQLICGTLSPTSGTILTRGRIAALLELGSGFNPEFTGRENVFLNAAVLGLSTDETKSRFDQIVTFADIGDFLDQPVKTYSSGMSVRLAFSVAINVDPQILVVDEALSVGDELFQRKCFARIESIKKSGATILFVSHAGGTIVELCDHAILMDAGEMLTIGRPKDIVAKYQKLIYAPADKQNIIRNSIQSAVDNKLIIAHGLSNLAVHDESTPSGPKESKDIQVEFYDPNIRSTTTLTYESLGATICEPRIVTLTGNRINWLKVGGIYNYVYEVKFDKDAFDVRFGMMFKAINGIEIGGIGTATSGHGLEQVTAGTTIRVQFTFQCHLISGHYFGNAGCSGKVNGTDSFLHRIVDALAFRVLPLNPSEARAGYVDFSTSNNHFILDYIE